MVFFEARLQATQDADGLLDGRLRNVDFLEAPGQGMVFFENAPVFRISGCPDAFQVAGGQGGLEQVGRIQRAARRRTGPDQGMDLVDEQHGVAIVLQCLEHHFQTLFEIAPVFGARKQRPHVQCIDLGFVQDFGHIALGDAPGQAFGNGGLADTGFTDQQRIVLAPTAQHLDDAFDFVFATDQRIDAAFQGFGVEVGRVGFQWRFLLFGLGIGSRRFLARVFCSRRFFGDFGDAMRQIIDHVQPGHALLHEEIHRMRILFAVHGHQHVGAGHGVFAGAIGRHMHDGALDHTLEPQRRLRVDLAFAWEDGRVFDNEFAQVLTQQFDVGGAGTQDLDSRGVVQQGQQQVLYGDEFMSGGAGLHERHVQADFEFFGNHASSIAYRSGSSNPLCLFYD